ncbi:MAG TPA: hypothetical protein VGF21_09040 [Thermoleophilaceae bacterium]
MPERSFSDEVAARTSRRGFLDRVGRILLGATGVGAVAAAVPAGDADAFHFCGHTYTTGSCPHPTGLPRVDAHGLPLRAGDGKRVDDLGRVVNREGRPVDGQGRLLRDPDGRPLPPAPRTAVCAGVAREYGMHTQVDGSWYRCCGGFVRRLMDCCSYNSRRINGDSALTGYCYSGRKVFCVHYYQTKVPC